jgi:hypothetical protein
MTFIAECRDLVKGAIVDELPASKKNPPPCPRNGTAGQVKFLHNPFVPGLSTWLYSLDIPSNNSGNLSGLAWELAWPKTFALILRHGSIPPQAPKRVIDEWLDAGFETYVTNEDVNPGGFLHQGTDFIEVAGGPIAELLNASVRRAHVPRLF